MLSFYQFPMFCPLFVSLYTVLISCHHPLSSSYPHFLSSYPPYIACPHLLSLYPVIISCHLLSSSYVQDLVYCPHLQSSSHTGQFFLLLSPHVNWSEISVSARGYNGISRGDRKKNALYLHKLSFQPSSSTAQANLQISCPHLLICYHTSTPGRAVQRPGGGGGAGAQVPGGQVDQGGGRGRHHLCYPGIT